VRVARGTVGGQLEEGATLTEALRGTFLAEGGREGGTEGGEREVGGRKEGGELALNETYKDCTLTYL